MPIALLMTSPFSDERGAPALSGPAHRNRQLPERRREKARIPRNAVPMPLSC
jgi:hypothetical protein